MNPPSSLFRKVEMNMCRNLSPYLIAAICGDLCSCNSVEEVEVTSYGVVSVLFVCLTTQYKPLSSVSKLPLKLSTFVWLHLTGDGPFLFNTVFLCSCSSHLHSFAFFVVCSGTECYTSVPCVVRSTCFYYREWCSRCVCSADEAMQDL